MYCNVYHKATCDGRISQTKGSVTAIEWEVTDDKLLRQPPPIHPDTNLMSPPFKIGDVTWTLRMSSLYVYVKQICRSNARVELIRHSPETNTPCMNCQMMMMLQMKNDDEIYGGCTRICRQNEEVLRFDITVTANKVIKRENSDVLKIVFILYPVVEVDTLDDATNEGIDILTSNLKNLFLQPENYDLTIKVRGRAFDVHKAILSSRSPVLSAMLRHNMAEKNSGVIDIVDCEPDIFESFLLYLYSGQVEELSWENATHLYTLGDKYDMPHLRKQCMKFVEGNMCVEGFSDTIAMAVKHNLSALADRAEEFFLNNARSILVTPKWQLLMQDSPLVCNQLFMKYAENKNALY